MESVRFFPHELDVLFNSPEGPVAKDLARRAIRVERAAKRLAPVDTGRLRASITHEIQRDARGLLAMIGSNVSYAAYQEFGTSHQRGSAYLRPALYAEINR